MASVRLSLEGLVPSSVTQHLCLMHTVFLGLEAICQGSGEMKLSGSDSLAEIGK